MGKGAKCRRGGIKNTPETSCPLLLVKKEIAQKRREREMVKREREGKEQSLFCGEVAKERERRKKEGSKIFLSFLLSVIRLLRDMRRRGGGEDICISWVQQSQSSFVLL